LGPRSPCCRSNQAIGKNVKALRNNAMLSLSRLINSGWGGFHNCGYLQIQKSAIVQLLWVTLCQQ
jgi:hypothetical protein